MLQQTARKIWPRENNWSGSNPSDDSSYTKTDLMWVLKEFHIKAVAENKDLTECAHPYYKWQQEKLGWLEAQLAERAAKKEAKAKKVKANRKQKARPAGVARGSPKKVAGVARGSPKKVAKSPVATFRSPHKVRGKDDDQADNEGNCEREVTCRSPRLRGNKRMKRRMKKRMKRKMKRRKMKRRTRRRTISNWEDKVLFQYYSSCKHYMYHNRWNE